MENDKQIFANYVHSAADLAESVKRDLQKGGTITSNTAIALNAFMIASNAVKDIMSGVLKDTSTLN